MSNGEEYYGLTKKGGQGGGVGNFGKRKKGGSYFTKMN